MKYYSEKLDKLFDTDEQLVAEELKADEEARKAEEEKAAKEKAVSSKKKELARLVDEADKKFNEAEKKYAEAKSEAKKRYSDFVKKQKEELDKFYEENLKEVNDCVEALKAAESERYGAIKNYNKEFGIYKRYVTEEEAEKCLKRSLSIFDDLFDFWF